MQQEITSNILMMYIYYKVAITYFVRIEKDDFLTFTWAQGCFHPNW